MNFLTSLAFLFVFQLAVPNFSYAKDHQLFSGNEISADYDKMVSRIRAGDTLIFSNGQKFTVERILGHGYTTLILAIKEDPTKALRIPLNREEQSYTESYIRGYKMLAKAELPTVKVYESYGAEYVVVEKLTDYMTFADFANAASAPRLITWWRRISGRKSPLPLQEMEEKFYLFARLISLYDSIGDLNASNLIYDFKTQEWRLMDWTAELEPTSSEEENPMRNILRRLNLTGKRYEWLAQFIGNSREIIEQNRQRILSGKACAQSYAQ